MIALLLEIHEHPTFIPQIFIEHVPMPSIIQELDMKQGTNQMALRTFRKPVILS